MKKTYKIGEMVYPIDNSYSQDLSNGQYPKENKGAALAGFQGMKPVLVEIISNPLQITLPNVFGEKDVREMVIVKYNNKLFLVLNCFTKQFDEIDDF